SGVINDWNGGAYDSTHHRLVFSGGGHHGYYGNEVYALQLDVGPSGKIVRLNDPTPNPTSNWPADSCDVPDVYWDGRPNQVHNYGSLVYLPARDVLWQQGGALSPCGAGSDATWQLNLGNLPSLGYPSVTQWTRLGQNSIIPGAAFRGNGDAQT